MCRVLIGSLLVLMVATLGLPRQAYGLAAKPAKAEAPHAAEAKDKAAEAKHGGHEADQHGSEAKPGAHGADAHGGGHSRGPVEADLGIWTIVVFILLFLFLKYVPLPGAGASAWDLMLQGLHKREESIRTAIEDARLAREETQRMRTQLQQELDKAHEKVREILDEARRDAQHATDEMLGKARAEIQMERERLRREINTACDQALQEVWSKAADLASLMTAKLIRRQLTIEDQHKLIDEALQELGQANVGWRDRALY